ncbi:unnamed protein product [Rhizoctonia solani]|uniref:Uncharacterized protein n=1 Tax=Rhizoctonia solani TaxID=456999 RepID=A0A8H3GSM7_9AGAM|nr:unnamed protein product [Rhizoctonia solani]
MALTARATSPPRWGEQIVPTLRKRLEHESRALTKRMSQPVVEERAPATMSEESDIPRASMQSMATDETPRRPRTHSQPRPFERDVLTPAPSRSASPAVTRPSRIPTRPRAGSRPIPTEFPPSPDPSPDLGPSIRTQLTPPTPDRPRRKRDTFVPPAPDDADEFLFDEPAPFAISNGNSLAGRSSLDEYEHWYRGEGRGGGGRNGGRGEIRIATRTEMLEIASFGHPPSRNNSRHYAEFGLRNKAYDDSTVGTRFRWPDENEQSVLDEAPLTDLDDMDTESYHPGSQEARSIEVRSIDSYQPDVRSEEEDILSELEPDPDGRPEPVTPAKPLPSRIARAVSPPVPGASTTSLVSRPARSPTPSKARSTTSKPQSPPPKSQSPPPKVQSPKAKSPARRGTNASTVSKSPSRAGTSQLSPKPASTPKTPRIGASPGRNNTSPSPRTRAQSTSTKSTGTKRTKKLSTSGDTGPHPLADAIPPIPPDQQIPDDGNWDDVVLPTIARRMQGGEDVVMLERKPIEEKEEPIPPAPGTFGYLERQKEKERKEREQRRTSGTELEEFGAWDRKPKPVPKPVEKAVEKAEERRKAPSPPPFSDYTPVPPVVKPPEPTPAPVVQPMVISEADLRQNMPDRSKHDSHDAGCCKCVVM